MNILIIGDVFGSPGRHATRRLLPALREKHSAEFIVVNCDNATHGKGVNEDAARELFGAGADVLTGGNHVFSVKGTDELIDREPRLLRPINFPPDTPGRGSGVFASRGGAPVAVVHACGRVFMEHFDDPFRALEAEIARLHRQTPIIIVDLHAEATSEKVGMGWFLDGQVSAVVGTHTHIQTADERVLPRGTAYITDLGMTGSYDSVIGADREAAIASMRNLRRTRFFPADPGHVRLCGVLIEVDITNGQAIRIERINELVGNA